MTGASELDDVEKVRAALLPTWQSAAAVAQHASVPALTAVAVLKRYETAWQLEGRWMRVDGHNQIRIYRKRQLQTVLGVALPVDQINPWTGET